MCRSHVHVRPRSADHRCTTGGFGDRSTIRVECVAECRCAMRRHGLVCTRDVSGQCPLWTGPCLRKGGGGGRIALVGWPFREAQHSTATAVSPPQPSVDLLSGQTTSIRDPPPQRADCVRARPPDDFLCTRETGQDCPYKSNGLCGLPALPLCGMGPPGLLPGGTSVEHSGMWSWNTTDQWFVQSCLSVSQWRTALRWTCNDVQYGSQLPNCQLPFVDCSFKPRSYCPAFVGHPPPQSAHCPLRPGAVQALWPAAQALPLDYCRVPHLVPTLNQ